MTGTLGMKMSTVIELQKMSRKRDSCCELWLFIRHSTKSSIAQEERQIDDKAPPAAHHSSEVARTLNR